MVAVHFIEKGHLIHAPTLSWRHYAAELNERIAGCVARRPERFGTGIRIAARDESSPGATHEVCKVVRAGLFGPR
jgi:hypothetical protein